MEYILFLEFCFERGERRVERGERRVERGERDLNCKATPLRVGCSKL
jgi:hypothetical protein